VRPWLLALGGGGGLLAVEARDLGEDLLRRQTNTISLVTTSDIRVIS
jgi:hypothetical protein